MTNCNLTKDSTKSNTLKQIFSKSLNYDKHSIHLTVEYEINID